MTEIIDRLWVGGDEDFEKIKDKKGWSVLRACKDGVGGHRQTLGYTSHAAPKGPNYLTVRRKHRLALNLVDSEDPNFISEKAVNEGIKFIAERMDAGDNVLVSCNQGQSRSPAITMLYMRDIGELPDSFRSGANIFKTLYPPYNPGQGMLRFLKSHYHGSD